MKFQSDSEDESSIDSDSNAGLTRRNRISNNDEKNLSGSLGDLSKSINSLTESHSTNSISFRCSESESDDMYSRFLPIDATQQKKFSKKTPKPKNKISDRSSDDSIIFVDSNTTNNEKLDEKGSNKMKKTTTTSGKQNVKTRAKSQDNFAKRTEKNKLKRQYIYIQVNKYSAE